MDPVAVFADSPPPEAPVRIDRLVVPTWHRTEWERVFRQGLRRSLTAHEVLIQSGATDRSLHFVVGGDFEVGITYVDGMSMSTVAQINAGTVIGEQSFFDGHPRSANVWAVSEGEVLTLPFDAFERLAAEEPALARDLTFALARVLSLRLRNTTVRVRR
ncbi:MAG: Crp/Fnr family transcriptional regulator [Burkholderiales bacterium]